MNLTEFKTLAEELNPGFDLHIKRNGDTFIYKILRTYGIECTIKNSSKEEIEQQIDDCNTMLGRSIVEDTHDFPEDWI